MGLRDDSEWTDSTGQGDIFLPEQPRDPHVSRASWD